jgi:hypothetical protein
MRKIPLYPKSLSKADETVHRTIIPRLAWKMIVFILFIARALPGNKRKEPNGKARLLLGPARAFTSIPQRDSRGIAAYSPSGDESDKKEDEKGGPR